MTDDYVTRNEFNLLNGKVDALSIRMENIDKDGTRGTLALQQQMTDVIKDVADVKLDVTTLRTDVGTRFDKLALERESDRKERANSRRWAISATIAGAASLAGVYGLLADILSHIH